MFDARLIKKIALARYFLHLAETDSRSISDLSLFATANNLQDSVEIFLLAVAEYVNAGVDQKTTFDKYFDLINAKIQPKELPFRLKLVALNKIRVNAKHYAIQPDRAEVVSLVVVVREFCEETTRAVLGAEFGSINLLTLLANPDMKAEFSRAESCLNRGDYVGALVSCRKALYDEIDSRFDISQFKGQMEPSLWSGFFCEAPYYARSGKYIDEQVMDPTDFIVFDHGTVEKKLREWDVPHNLFWNFWRLTPEIFRNQTTSDWIVKNEFRKFDSEDLKERAEFVFSAGINIALAIQKHRDSTRQVAFRNYTIQLQDADASVFSKADKESAIVGHIDGGTTVLSKFSVTGFDGALYWRVSFDRENNYLSGYIRDSDVCPSKT